MGELNTVNHLSRVKLIVEPTPVASHAALGKLWDIPNLSVKREDLTDRFGYGGNKVRNLEFLLGEALQRKAKKIFALAPVGSNFTAALASQARKVALPVEIFHFTASDSRQIRQHAQFTRGAGAKLHIAKGRLPLSIPQAYFHSLLACKNETYFMPTGGSSARGALGHVNAALELAEQVRQGEVNEPELLFVGAGTCGTMAGLLVGLALSGMKTKLIGVRCVDLIYCNRYRIATLANSVAQLVGLRRRFGPRDVNLIRPAGFAAYGGEDSSRHALIEETLSVSDLTLDTTYTTNVVRAMRDWLSREELQTREVLYWHTFSPKAMEFQSLSESLLARPKATAIMAVT